MRSFLSMAFALVACGGSAASDDLADQGLAIEADDDVFEADAVDELAEGEEAAPFAATWVATCNFKRAGIGSTSLSGVLKSVKVESGAGVSRYTVKLERNGAEKTYVGEPIDAVIPTWNGKPALHADMKINVKSGLFKKSRRIALRVEWLPSLSPAKYASGIEVTKKRLFGGTKSLESHTSGEAGTTTWGSDPLVTCEWTTAS